MTASVATVSVHVVLLTWSVVQCSSATNSRASNDENSFMLSYKYLDAFSSKTMSSESSDFLILDSCPCSII